MYGGTYNISQAHFNRHYTTAQGRYQEGKHSRVLHLMYIKSRYYLDPPGAKGAKLFSAVKR